MTGPAGAAADVGTPRSDATESDFAWLRTNPANIPSSTPKTFKDLVRSGEDTWLQIYKEWLVGETNGAPNIAKVAGEPDDVLTWFGTLAAHPDQKTAQGPRDIAPDIKIGKFQASYPDFAAQIDVMRQAVQARAKAMKQAAKESGDKVPSTKEALKAAGRETQRVTMANAAAAQGKTLDVNVGLIVQVQIEKYKATGLEMYLAALIQITDTPWDAEEGGGGDKAEAVRVMETAGSAVIAAAGNLKIAADKIKKTPADQNVDRELATEMFDRMIEFNDAINRQGAAMTKTGELVAGWARRQAAAAIKKDFQTIYPNLAGAMLALRVAVNVSQAVLDFFPPFNTIGIGLGVADAALEMAVRELVAWHASQDKETQAGLAGQEYVIDKENMSLAAKGALAIVKVDENTFGKLNEYTFGLAEKGVAAVAVPAAKAVAKGLGAGESMQASSGRVAASMVGVANAQKENFANAVTKGENSIPLSAESLVTTVVTKAAGRAVPGLGTTLAVKSIVVDIAQFEVDQNKVLQNKAGLTDEDVAAMRQLIRGGVNNPYHSSFASGEIALETRQAGPPPHIYARVDGVRVKITLGDEPRVDNADPEKLTKNIVGLAKGQAKEQIEHQGKIFHLSWDSAQLANSAHPLYTVVADAVTYVGAAKYPVKLELRYDMKMEMLDVATVHGEVPADALAGILAKNQGTSEDALARKSFEQAKQFVITSDDLMGFAGREVAFGGEVFTLEGNPTGGAMDAEHGTAAFQMEAKKPDKSVHRLFITYSLNGGMEVEGAEEIMSAEVAMGVELRKQVEETLKLKEALRSPQAAQEKKSKARKLFDKAKDALGV